MINHQINTLRKSWPVKKSKSSKFFFTFTSIFCYFWFLIISLDEWNNNNSPRTGETTYSSQVHRPFIRSCPTNPNNFRTFPMLLPLHFVKASLKTHLNQVWQQEISVTSWMDDPTVPVWSNLRRPSRCTILSPQSGQRARHRLLWNCFTTFLNSFDLYDWARVGLNPSSFVWNIKLRFPFPTIPSKKWKLN